jgi:hypothetical protein
MINALGSAARIVSSGRRGPGPKGLPRRSALRAKAGWTPERRARQAARVHLWRPWRLSTGPRSDAGKARSAVNALKHGCRSRAHLQKMCEIRRVLRVSARNIAFGKTLLAALSAGRSAQRRPERDARPVPTNVDTWMPMSICINIVDTWSKPCGSC